MSRGTHLVGDSGLKSRNDWHGITLAPVYRAAITLLIIW